VLMNRTKVKEFALEMAKHRAHKFTRAGSAFFIKCEANLWTFIRNQIHSLPSKGTTLSLARISELGSGILLETRTRRLYASLAFEASGLLRNGPDLRREPGPRTADMTC
jgi:hypothetical protein